MYIMHMLLQTDVIKHSVTFSNISDLLLEVLSQGLLSSLYNHKVYYAL